MTAPTVTPMSDFVWVELLTPDLQAAAKFYETAVGWRVVSHPASDEYKVVGMGEPQRGVGGIMSLSPQMLQAGARAGWMGYLAVDDVDAAAAAVAADGGAVLRAPGDLPGVGRFCVIADPQGAEMYLFKPVPPVDGILAPLTPGAIGSASWYELHATDGDAAWGFYSRQFGWQQAGAMDMGSMGSYRMFKTNDQPMMGGMMTMAPPMKASGAPPAWLYYFQVDNIHAAKARIESAGGTVIHGPSEVPGPQWVMQAFDPQGSMFAVVSSDNSE